MIHIGFTVAIALFSGMCGFCFAPKAIKYQYQGYKRRSFLAATCGQLFALAFGFSLLIPVLFALTQDPVYQALLYGFVSWVLVSVICAVRTYNRYRRVFRTLQEKAT